MSATRCSCATGLSPSRSRARSRIFLGGALLLWLGWQIPSILGIDVGRWRAGAVGPGIRRHAGADRSDLLAAGRPRDLGLRGRGGRRRGGGLALPYKLNIVVAVVAAVAAGLMMEMPGGGAGARSARRSPPGVLPDRSVRGSTNARCPASKPSSPFSGLALVTVLTRSFPDAARSASCRCRRGRGAR